MKNIDFNKIKAGIKFPIVLGLGLLIAEYILLMIITFGVPFVVNELSLDMDFSSIVGSFNLAIILLFFAPLFFWTGYRTSKRYMGDLIEAGLSASVVAVVILIIDFAIKMLLYLVATIGDITILKIAFTNVSMEGLLSAALNMPPGTIIQIIMLNICCIGRLFVSLALNFLVGGIGGYFGGGDRK